jgi:adenylate cyclase
LGGEKRCVTMLMADLRGFTALTERMAPEQVVTVLNRYLGTMTDVITRYQGTIDEFVGDGIFVIFGAPVARDDDVQRAVACALHMQIAMDGLNEMHRREGASTFEMGIGVHTGDVVVGNIGSETRKKYGVVGHAVNLASRLESYTIGRQVLISEATWQVVHTMVEVTARLDITAKGMTTPITVYDVFSIGEPYHLTLPRRAETLVNLQAAVPLQYSVLSGKNIATTTFTGEFVKLSLQGGEVRAATPIEALRNVQVRLLNATGEPLPGTIYAKTVEALIEAQPGFRLHFTSISPEAAMVIQELLASDPSAS